MDYQLFKRKHKEITDIIINKNSVYIACSSGCCSKYALFSLLKTFCLLSPFCLLLSLFRLCCPSLSVSLLSCCFGALLCDIHFNHFIMHLVGRRWALNRWKFIKGALITICPLKMALLILFGGGGLHPKGSRLCLRFVLSIICTNCFRSVRLKWAESARVVCYAFSGATFS